MAKDVVVKVVANTSQFDNNMKKATSTLTQFGKGGVANITSMLGPWGKLAAAIGGAKVAQEAFNKTINSTQATQDAWGRTMAKAQAATDGFFAALARGNMGDFISNLGTTLSLAEQLYNKLDDMSSMQLRSDFAINMIDAQKQIYLLKMKDKTLSDEERENAKEMYNLAVKRTAALRRGIGNAEIDAGVTGIQTLFKENAKTVIGRDTDVAVIARKAAKNIEIMEQDVLYYAENFSTIGDEFKEIMSTYRSNVRAAENNIKLYSKKQDEGNVRYWMRQREALDADLQKTLETFPEYLMSYVLGEVKDDAASELKQYFDMILNGRQRNTQTAQDIYAGNRAGSSIGASTASASTTSTEPVIEYTQEELSTMAQIRAQLIRLENPIEEGWDDLVNVIEEAEKPLENLSKKTVDLQGNLQGVAQIMATVGNTFATTGKDGAAAFMNIMSSVIPLIGAVMALTVVEGEEKAARSSKNWIELIAAIAAVTGTIVGTFQANKDAGKYAEGGIVGGNSYYGDKLIAHVNSGEGILTRQGIRNLDTIMSGRGEGTIRVDIKNDKLTGTLRNAYGRSKYTS